MHTLDFLLDFLLISIHAPRVGSDGLVRATM